MSSGSVFHGVWTVNNGSVLGNSGMLMRLNFDEETRVVSGEGSDYFGCFRIIGLFLEANIRFTKTYVGSNGNCGWLYTGERVSSSHEPEARAYVGQWGTTRGTPYGRFAISNTSTSQSLATEKEVIDSSSWEGTYTNNSRWFKRKAPAMACCISITTSTEPIGLPERIAGVGIDAEGPFGLEGDVDGSGRVLITKKYRDRIQHWKYVGTLDRRGQTISGHWGENESDVRGTFTLKRTPPTITSTNPGLLAIGKGGILTRVKDELVGLNQFMLNYGFVYLLVMYIVKYVL